MSQQPGTEQVGSGNWLTASKLTDEGTETGITHGTAKRGSKPLEAGPARARPRLAAAPRGWEHTPSPARKLAGLRGPLPSLAYARPPAGLRAALPREGRKEPRRGAGRPRPLAGRRDPSALLGNPGAELQHPAKDGGGVRTCSARGLALASHCPRAARAPLATARAPSPFRSPC